MIPTEDLTDVNLAIEDTHEDDEDDEDDLTDVTLVSDDTYWRLVWCCSSWGSDESYQVMKVIKWWELSSDESYQVTKVIKWWKLSSDESYLVMKVI